MSSTIQGQLLGWIPRDSICYMVVCIILIYLIVEVIVTNKCTRKSGEVDEFRPTCKTRSWSQEAFTMSSQQKEPKICGSVVGHLPETYGIDISKLPRGEGRPWNQMKWMGKLARCWVKGQLLRALTTFRTSVEGGHWSMWKMLKTNTISFLGSLGIGWISICRQDVYTLISEQIHSSRVFNGLCKCILVISQKFTPSEQSKCFWIS
jgi:hypothetical protein